MVKVDDAACAHRAVVWPLGTRARALASDRRLCAPQPVRPRSRCALRRPCGRRRRAPDATARAVGGTILAIDVAEAACPRAVEWLAGLEPSHNRGWHRQAAVATAVDGACVHDVNDEVTWHGNRGGHPGARFQRPPQILGLIANEHTQPRHAADGENTRALDDEDATGVLAPDYIVLRRRQRGQRRKVLLLIGDERLLRRFG